MRHHVFGKKLGRDIKQRTALLRSLVDALVMHAKIETTIAKARAVRPLVERLVTHAKDGSTSARRQIASIVRQQSIIDRLLTDIAPRFADRPGGYTRMHRVATRAGDDGQTVVLEWVTAKTQKPEEKKGVLLNVPSGPGHAPSRKATAGRRRPAPAN